MKQSMAHSPWSLKSGPALRLHLQAAGRLNFISAPGLKLIVPGLTSQADVGILTFSTHGQRGISVLA